eukprot:11894558-Alexandrium_andersonii.AAC.1
MAPQLEASAGPDRPGPRRDIVRAGVIDAVSDNGINLAQQGRDAGLRGQGGLASWSQLAHLK